MVKLNRNKQPVDEEPSYDIDIEDEDEEDEHEGYNDEEDEHEEYEEDGRKRKFLIIGGVIAVIIVGAITVRMFTSTPKKTTSSTAQTTQVKKEKKKKVTKSSSTEKKKEEESTTSTSAPVDYAAEAKETLERPNAPATDAEKEAIASHITQAIDKAVQALPNAKNDQESGLFLTSNTMMNMVIMALSMNYRPDMATLQAYKSDNENVNQFTIDFKKDGQSVTFTGNYAPAIEQLEFAQIHGDLPVESASHEKQVDTEKAKAESDTPLHPESIDDGGNS